MSSSDHTLLSIPPFLESQIVSASSLHISLSAPPQKFYRHGWQSWTLTTWLDPAEPPQPVRAAEFRAKDEDPGYALHKNHISAWMGAVELGKDDVLLLDSLGMSGRVELEGMTLQGFYEDGHEAPWLIARGSEGEVFSRYANLLEKTLGSHPRKKTPRVWCSWYSLYRWINERILLRAFNDLFDMPFDVFQVDDGWQVAYGDWEPNRKFRSGMNSLAEKINALGCTAGLWLAPFMVSPDSRLAKDHPDWLLRDETGKPVRAGITWTGNPYCLDSSHPGVLEWLATLIRKVRDWGYGYLKLDFLYIGALIGKRYANLPRENAYRNALQVMREAAGGAYLLACGAPIFPSLGLCDGLRIGPDVAPFWRNTPLTIWLNNPNDTSTQNAIRTSLHRLWLHQIVDVDPDVAFFRSRHVRLKPNEKQLLQDLGTIAGFRSTSDLPQWLCREEKENLHAFLMSAPAVEKTKRYEYQIDERWVDFSAAIPIPTTGLRVPAGFAKYLGLLKIGMVQALPALLERMRHG